MRSTIAVCWGKLVKLRLEVKGKQWWILVGYELNTKPNYYFAWLRRYLEGKNTRKEVMTWNVSGSQNQQSLNPIYLTAVSGHWGRLTTLWRTRSPIISAGMTILPSSGHTSRLIVTIMLASARCERRRSKLKKVSILQMSPLNGV